MLQPSTAFVLEDQAKMAAARNYFAWQSRLVLKELGQRVVEVGCGIGNFTVKLLDRELVVALDIETDCAQQAQARFPGKPNLEVFHMDAGSGAFNALERFRPDSFVCLNVLEHIAGDRELIAKMAAMLPSGGVIVLLVPAFEALYGPLDRNLGHYRRYTRRGIVQLAEATGLKVKKVHYVNAVGMFGWWANARIFRRETQSLAQIAFFDRYVAPLLSRVESIVKPPFGQSVFAVLEKM